MRIDTKSKSNRYSSVHHKRLPRDIGALITAQEGNRICHFVARAGAGEWNSPPFHVPLLKLLGRGLIDSIDNAHLRVNTRSPQQYGPTIRGRSRHMARDGYSKTFRATLPAGCGGLAAEALARMIEHLAANEVDIQQTPITLGSALAWNRSTKQFDSDPNTNHLLKGEYRRPFVASKLARRLTRVDRVLKRCRE
jgi:hypothetical protein